MSMANTSGSGSSGYPLDNLTYDLVTILYEKSKALEAYDKYIRDAQNNQQVSQLLQQMRQQDEQHIRQIQQHLGQLLSSQAGTQSQSVGGGSSMGGSTMSDSPTGG